MRNSIRLSLVIAILVTALSATAFSEAPRLINYQGRVLASTGAPVANGPHTFDFRLYDTPVGGALQWDELGVVIVTTNALFTYSLGASSPFLSNLFVNADELWLEVTVDAQLQTPRTRLISTPYAETAGNLSLESPFFPGQLVYQTDPSQHRFSTYGSDGLEQIRLWGDGWGEIFLYDFDGTNDLTATLTANGSDGGELRLGDDGGITTIDLHGGLTGNGSAQLPANAIYDVEILDEPGVANQVRASTFFTPVAGDQKIDSVDITIPTSGYVEITAGCYLNMWHTTGTTTNIEIGISQAGTISFTEPGAATCRVDGALPSALYQYPCTNTRLYSEAAGTHRYYYNVDRLTGANASLNIAQIYVRAKFYPTAYGSVVLATSNNDPNPPRLANVPSDGTISHENLTLQVHTLQEINAKLAEEAEVLRAENERLRKEQAVQNGAVQNGNPR